MVSQIFNHNKDATLIRVVTDRPAAWQKTIIAKTASLYIIPVTV